MSARSAIAPVRLDANARYVPPPYYEYWFYTQVFYSIMAPILGISISMLGVAMLGVLVLLCVLRMGRYSTVLLLPLAAPLATGVSFLGIQILFHGESLMGGDYVREFVPWMMGLIILQCLALRPGFLHRFAIAALLIGLSTLPYMRSFVNDASRAGLAKSISIANPNDLGAWFGFCFVYFIILGLETRRLWVRSLASVTAVFCLLVVGLTVSRAPLFAAAFSTLLAFRRILKRGLFPLFCVVLLAAGAYGMGLFEQSVANYAQRGLEETGRFLVWPPAIRRFLAQPLTGVGASHVSTWIPLYNVAIVPHNGFIFIGLASGIVPLVCFIIYWAQLSFDCIRVNAASHEDAPFQTSLLVYCFLITMELNEAFMAPWIMATLATITSTAFLMRARRAVRGQQGAPRASLRPDFPALGRSRA